MKQYKIKVDYGTHGYNIKGNIFVAINHLIKIIDKRATIEVNKWN